MYDGLQYHYSVTLVYKLCFGQSVSESHLYLYMQLLEEKLDVSSIMMCRKRAKFGGEVRVLVGWLGYMYKYVCLCVLCVCVCVCVCVCTLVSFPRK